MASFLPIDPDAPIRRLNVTNYIGDWVEVEVDGQTLRMTQLMLRRYLQYFRHAVPGRTWRLMESDIVSRTCRGCVMGKGTAPSNLDPHCVFHGNIVNLEMWNSSGVPAKLSFPHGDVDAHMAKTLAKKYAQVAAFDGLVKVMLHGKEQVVSVRDLERIVKDDSYVVGCGKSRPTAGTWDPFTLQTRAAQHGGWDAFQAESRLNRGPQICPNFSPIGGWAPVITDEDVKHYTRMGELLGKRMKEKTMSPQAAIKFYVLSGPDRVIGAAIDKKAAIDLATEWVNAHPDAIVTIAKAVHRVRRKPQPVIVEVVR